MIYDVYCKKGGSLKFKPFRNSLDGELAIQDATAVVKKYLKILEVLSPSVDNKKAFALIQEFESLNTGFNDGIIIEACKKIV